MDAVDEHGELTSRGDLQEAILNLMVDLDDPNCRWQNESIEDYLGALYTWLGSYELNWTRYGQEPPEDPWVIFRHALAAAARDTNARL